MTSDVNIQQSAVAKSGPRRCHTAGVIQGLTAGVTQGLANGDAAYRVGPIPSLNGHTYLLLIVLMHQTLQNNFVIFLRGKIFTKINAK